MFGLTRNLTLRVFKDADGASEAGFSKEDKYKDAKPLEINTAVVVKNGTVSGNSTVDLVMEDKDGNKYVAMITGTLVKLLPL
jgi:hypothetical protein